MVNDFQNNDQFPIFCFPSSGFREVITGYRLPILLSLLLFISPLLSTAQDDKWGKEGEIEKVEIVIQKERQITLPKANRNFEKVPPRPAEPIKPEITYSFKEVSFTILDFNPAIRPFKLKAEPIAKLYGNYLSAGFGNYASPYLDGYATTKRDKNKFYGAKLFHHSFGSGPVDGGNSASGSTELKVFGKAFTQSVAVGGFLGFENRSANFYGTLPGVFKGDASHQSYSVFNIGGDVGNSTKVDFNYNLKGGFSYLKDAKNSTENEVNFNFTSGYKIDEERKVIIDADYYLMARKFASQDSPIRHIFKIKPSYQFSPIDNLILTIGFNTAFDNDTLGTAKTFRFYPHVAARYELSEGVQVYGTVTGDLDKVSLHSLSRENMWLNQNVGLNNTNRTIEILGGLKGKLSSKLAYHVGLSIANLKNFYFYANNPTAPEKLDVVYDQGNVKRTNLFAEVGYSSAQAIKLLLRADYFGYSTDKVPEAWHRPTYRIGFTSSYNLYNKLLFDVDFIAQGGMKALVPVFTYKTEEIGTAVDLNVKGSYLVSNQFSVFVKCSNILNNNYQVYLYYPVRGFQAMAGISFSF